MKKPLVMWAAQSKKGKIIPGTIAEARDEIPYLLFGQMSDEFQRKFWKRLEASKKEYRKLGIKIVKVGVLPLAEIPVGDMRGVNVTMDEHHSSMGTSSICRFISQGKERAIGGNFPMYDLGFDVRRGRRFLVTVNKLPDAPGMKPEENPFQMKRRRK